MHGIHVPEIDPKTHYSCSKPPLGIHQLLRHLTKGMTATLESNYQIGVNSSNRSQNHINEHLLLPVGCEGF